MSVNISMHCWYLSGIKTRGKNTHLCVLLILGRFFNTICDYIEIFNPHIYVGYFAFVTSKLLVIHYFFDTIFTIN